MMNATLNDIVRAVIFVGTHLLGSLLGAVHAIRIRTFRLRQGRLRWKYGIRPDTPVLCYGPQLKASIQRATADAGRHWAYALTSGSTSEPKRILYTPRRLRQAKRTFCEVFTRACRACGIRRSSLFVFTSFARDESLTSMMVWERKNPGYLVTLQAPYRMQAHPAVRDLAGFYGAAAVRLWLLTVSNPGVLYATNPSTLVAFFDEVSTHWQKTRRLARDFCCRPETLDSRVYRLFRRLESRGSRQRLEVIARSDSPLPVEVWAPGLEAYMCWTGGYLEPFIERLERHLPSSRYLRIPMYSMSTEVVETVSHFRGRRVDFLPMAAGVLYEFLPEGAPDLPGRLCPPGELRVGRAYTLVVSDAYGLRRYQTGDLFLCRAKIRGVPDLQFLRRRGLEYSFTGEKITAEQVAPILRMIRRELSEEHFLTCVPSWPPEDPIPHYRLVAVSGNGVQPGRDLPGSARRFDELLAEANEEYRNKRETRRLGAARAERVELSDFIAWAGGPRHRKTWEGQFKFLPLYTRLWESTADGHSVLGVQFSA